MNNVICETKKIPTRVTNISYHCSTFVYGFFSVSVCVYLLIFCILLSSRIIVKMEQRVDNNNNETKKHTSNNNDYKRRIWFCPVIIS